MNLEIFAETDIGSVRENNEDNFTTFNLKTKQINPFSEIQDTNDIIALIVADGMGGAAAGETASLTLIEESLHFLNEELNLDLDRIPSECMHISHKKAHELISENSSLMGMGTVATICILENDSLYISQIGDTRLYIYRDKTLIQITEDQNFVTELVKIGIITEEQALIHPQRNAVTQAVGSVEPILPVDYFEKIKKNDLILICSDGLNSMLTDLEIQLVLETNSSLKEKVKGLIDQANEAGGHDNITIVLARVI
jgi:PPM family protein phosphatase